MRVEALVYSSALLPRSGDAPLEAILNQSRPSSLIDSEFLVMFNLIELYSGSLVSNCSPPTVKSSRALTASMTKCCCAFRGCPSSRLNLPSVVTRHGATDRSSHLVDGFITPSPFPTACYAPSQISRSNVPCVEFAALTAKA